MRVGSSTVGAVEGAEANKHGISVEGGVENLGLGDDKKSIDSASLYHGGLVVPGWSVSLV